MLNQSLLLAILASLVTYICTAPTAPTEPLHLMAPPNLQYELLHTIALEGGNLTTYGFTNSPNPLHSHKLPRSHLRKRCGENRQKCAWAYGYWANKDVCRIMYYELQEAEDWEDHKPLPLDPRAICRTHQNNRCCVSWAHPVPGLKREHLLPGINKMFDVCDGPMYSYGDISAQIDDVLLAETCTTQCLSNRPDGCDTESDSDWEAEELGVDTDKFDTPEESPSDKKSGTDTTTTDSD